MGIGYSSRRMLRTFHPSLNPATVNLTVSFLGPEIENSVSSLGYILRHTGLCTKNNSPGWRSCAVERFRTCDGTGQYCPCDDIRLIIQSPVPRLSRQMQPLSCVKIILLVMPF